MGNMGKHRLCVNAVEEQYEKRIRDAKALLELWRNKKERERERKRVSRTLRYPIATCVRLPLAYYQYYGVLYPDWKAC